MSLTPKLRVFVRLMASAMLALSCLAAHAAEDFEASALELADLPSEPAKATKSFHAYAEFAASQSALTAGTRQTVKRLSTYVQYDKGLIPNWRFSFSDRLDANWPTQTGDEHVINTMQEAYVTRKFGQSALVDIGRINVRNGVAASYNPTDYFKTGALRSYTSLDPVTLKDHRQGSVMVQGQTLWDSGSLTALYSPKLSDRADSGAFNLNLGGTNGSNRFLISLNQTVVVNVTSQFLLFKESQQAPQAGFNLTALSGKASVLNLEWSGGRSASGFTRALFSQGLDIADTSAFQSKIAVSATHTTTKKISITAELDYNGPGVQREQWNALRAGSSLSYNIYSNWALSQQELLTKKSAFFSLVWQDAMVNRLDLTALHRVDLVDRSRMMWIEARYRAFDSQLAIQFERYIGNAGSVFGSVPRQRSFLLLWRTYY